MKRRRRFPTPLADFTTGFAVLLTITLIASPLPAQSRQAPAQAERLPATGPQVTSDASRTGEVEQQRVLVPAERTQMIEPAIRSRATVPVITAAGMDSVAVVAGSIQLQRGQFAVLSTGGGEEVGGPSELPGREPAATADEFPFMTMPFRFVTPDSALTGEWVLRPVYKIGNRLRWEPESERFEGQLLLAVEDTTRRRESRPLPVPIRFELLSDAESIDPTSLAVEHTNLPLQTVRILARFAEDSLRVHLVPEFDLAGLDIWIPVAPSLTLSAPTRIQGWGIESARVVARVVGTASVRPAALTLTSTAGTLESVRLTTDESGSSETQLRSAGLGSATIAAGGAGFSTAAVEVDFIFPWVFLLAALLGGAFGGIGSAVHDGNGHKTARSRSLLRGVFAGLLAALAWYALGINLLQLDLGVPRFNEFAVFTLAALAGYFGIPGRAAPAAEVVRDSEVDVATSP